MESRLNNNGKFIYSNLYLIVLEDEYILRENIFLLLGTILFIILLTSLYTVSEFTYTILTKSEAMSNSTKSIEASITDPIDSILSDNSSSKDKSNFTVKKGQEFTTSLQSNPTTGYKWFAIFDKNKINLISQDYKPPSSMLIGGSGTDTFTFKAIGDGTTILKMIYKRSWEDKPVSEKVFLISIQNDNADEP